MIFLNDLFGLQDDDIVNVSNLRKCNVAALDVLSNVFGDEILPTLMPIIQAKLATSGDAHRQSEIAFGSWCRSKRLH
ncbi:hypothetical protein Patl1_28085 [Pistacia atlantica]|uniref:Uncharacterized protein n=1 Tax=Pistacia atlantica TaxID=434234 RepID=A0ACC1BBU4_9ROSI|nr:hypothetical protein Patl1_28085 [Pistacia atlantica]